jgi:hypothetical protein
VPVVLGVDVSLGRGLDLALVEDGVVKETRSAAGFDALRGTLREHAPDAVAIDAPPAPGLGLLEDESERAGLPVPPPPGKHLTRRVAEYELSRRGIGSHHTPRDEGRLFSWMTAGFETFAAASEAGYPAYLGRGTSRRRAFEVFPYASYVALAGGLSPGRRWRLAWRRAVLAGAGLIGLPDDAGIDVVDAACAALTGERYVRGMGSWVGDPREGVILLPVPALEERYHRCAPPDGGVRLAVTPAAPRLCECGCGLPVRRRFLPGHDAKLRADLVRQARAGAAARERLARLGWTGFLDH